MWDEQRIGVALNELGHLVDSGDDTLDVVALLEGSSAQPAPRHRLVGIAAAVAIVVAAGALLAIAPTRDAIADWFGIGRTQIELPDVGARPAQPPVEGLDTNAPSIGAGSAEAVLGRAVPQIPTLEPIEFRTPPEGGVLIVYADGLTLWVQVQEDGGPILRKTVGFGGSVTWLDDLGDGGALVSGPHTLTTPGRELGSDSVVLWTTRGLELRIEGDLPDSELLNLARSVEFG